MTRTKKPSLEQQLAALTERVAQLEADCPHCAREREDRAKMERARIENAAREKREAEHRKRVLAAAKKDPIVRIGLPDGTPSTRVEKSDLVAELGLQPGYYVTNPCYLRMSQWKRLAKQYAQEADSLVGSGVLTVTPTDDFAILEWHYREETGA